jgi:serine/threonine protein phosphatase PrpC
MIPVEQAHLKIAADTHTGVKGKNNEDRFSVSAYQLSVLDHTPSVFAIIADGIGGHRAGEVASEIAVEMISQSVAESDASQPVAIMQAAMIQASKTIHTQASNDEEKNGMGTTCVTAWLIGNRLYSAFVGNSRLYLLRSGKLIHLTVDHTWVQEAVDAGALTKEQARVHPNANVIRRYLGSPQEVEVDTRLRSERSGRYTAENQGQDIRPGDRLLLCSDGLNDMIPDEVIHELVSLDDLDEAVAALIEAANEAGGKDNITVILLEYPKKRGLAGLVQRLRLVKPQTVVAYAGLVVIGLGILAALVLYLMEIFS